jgi:beta-galactosidase
MMPMPGYAAELCGAEVEEFTFLSPYDEKQFVNIGGKRVSAPCFNDVLKITDGQAIGTFESNYYSGKTAVSIKNVGSGKAYYFGAAFDEDTAKAFIELVNISVPMNLDKIMDIPESIELAMRGEYVFLLNYSGETVEFNCNGQFTDMITGKEFSDKISINGYDAVVLNVLCVNNF